MPSGPETSATTADTEPVSDTLTITVREANELWFLASHEFYSARFEAFHELLRRVDKFLTDNKVERITSKFDV